MGSGASSCCSSYSGAPCFLPPPKTVFAPALPWGWAAVFSGFHKLVLLPPHSDPLPVRPPTLSVHAGSVWTSFDAKDSPRLIFRSVPFLSVPRQGSFISHFTIFTAQGILLTLVFKSLRHRSWSLRIHLRAAPWSHLGSGRSRFPICWGVPYSPDSEVLPLQAAMSPF